MQNNKRTVIATIGGMMMFVIAGGEASAQKIGVLGLYDMDKKATTAVDEKKIEEADCQIRLKGSIVDEQGDIDIDEPNRFIFLACDSSVLNNPVKRKILTTLVSKGEVLAVLEGPMMDLPNSSSTSAVEGREYIFKVSHYNNLDTNGRERDLKSIDHSAKARVDKWKTETFVGVNRALGMATPDEVVVLYYDSKKHAERFRKNSSDIIDLVNDFNDAHVEDFVYYEAKVMQ